ncbi:hypothetical protein F2Q70_00001032 [Brassica cretica]|uniref:Uncharacterized protein n=1 Tax=Brassica cretica TaxID=69181 RepID=A0A3N6PRX7_BRACR|nr:hypothetical protein F2Q70_00001032 [Brassica cretica]KAF3565792.1 hypothetical protein DY000_02012050 [Brassica cretica]
MRKKKNYSTCHCQNQGETMRAIANEITTIVNGSMLKTTKAFESHASLINLEPAFSSSTLVKPNNKKRGREEERQRGKEDRDGLD